MTLDELFSMAPTRTTVEDLLGTHEEVLPIRGFPSYLISSQGRVISLQGLEPTLMKTWPHATSEEVVELKSPHGESRILSVPKLRKDHFDGYKTCDSKIYDELLEEYEGNEEVEEWVKTELEDNIKRRK